jgi:hypothetical protein
MRIDGRSLCLAAATTFLFMTSCKPPNDESRQARQTSGPSPAEVAAVGDTMTRGMQQVAAGSLAAVHIGRQCVVIARAVDDRTGADQAPPPLGMVRKLRQTAIYKGEIQEVSPDSLKIRAAYPTSDRYKTIEISRPDIQSIYLAKPSSE